MTKICVKDGVCQCYGKVVCVCACAEEGVRKRM